MSAVALSFSKLATDASDANRLSHVGPEMSQTHVIRHNVRQEPNGELKAR
jgi:hypothetical protein